MTTNADQSDEFVRKLKESVLLTQTAIGMRILDEGPGDSPRKARLTTAYDIIQNEFESLLSS